MLLPYCLDCLADLPTVADRKTQRLECLECASVWDVFMESPQRFAVTRAQRVPMHREEISPYGPVIFRSHEPRSEFIRAEVEAMDWPDEIGE